MCLLLRLIYSGYFLLMNVNYATSVDLAAHIVPKKIHITLYSSGHSMLIVPTIVVRF